MRRKLTLALVLLGLVLATVGFEFGSPWPYCLGPLLGWTAIVGSAVVAYLQYRETRPFVHPFTEASWKCRVVYPEEGAEGVSIGSSLEIPASQHGKGRGASVEIYQAEGVKVETDVAVDPESGTVYLGATTTFSGMAIIK